MSDPTPYADDPTINQPRDDDELINIREKQREFRDKQVLQGLEKFATVAHAERVIVLDAVKQYGLNSLRILLVLNGGALLAVLGLISSLFARGETGFGFATSLAVAVLPSFYFYCGGLVLTAISSGLTYVHFNANATTHLTPWELQHYMLLRPPKEQPVIYEGTARLTAWLSVLSATLSLGAFIWGCYLVADAFASIPRISGR